jgi:hypothetical protein
MKWKRPGQVARIVHEMNDTAARLQPLVSALEQEGFAHFAKPCNSDLPMPSCPIYPRYPGKATGAKPQLNCTCGTPWSMRAQRMLGGVDDGTVAYHVVDAIHSVSASSMQRHDVCTAVCSCQNVMTVWYARIIRALGGLIGTPRVFKSPFMACP